MTAEIMGTKTAAPTDEKTTMGTDKKTTGVMDNYTTDTTTAKIRSEKMRHTNDDEREVAEAMDVAPKMGTEDKQLGTATKESNTKYAKGEMEEYGMDVTKEMKAAGTVADTVDNQGMTSGHARKWKETQSRVRT